MELNEKCGIIEKGSLKEKLPKEKPYFFINFNEQFVRYGFEPLSWFFERVGYFD